MTGRSRIAIVVTCEHGGHRIPARWRALFAGHEALLAGHRGWDPGALDVARAIARALDAPLMAAKVSRLLVDLNRSAHHRRLFSEITRSLPVAERDRILREHWQPYRARVEAAVGEAVASGARVVHLSSHSFAPALDGQVRSADVGLLYDPARVAERELCEAWRRALRTGAPRWRVRRNYPYRGVADGLVTHLRSCFDARCYAGVELELNQAALAQAAGPLTADVVAALRAALAASG